MTDTEQPEQEDIKIDPEELHQEIQDALMSIDNDLTEQIEALGKLRDSFDRSDPNHAKVSGWYITLLTKNPIESVVDEMDGQEADPDGDDQPTERVVVLSVPISQARAALKVLHYFEEQLPGEIDYDAYQKIVVELETAVG